jgi:hypothetical protein
MTLFMQKLSLASLELVKKVNSLCCSCVNFSVFEPNDRFQRNLANYQPQSIVELYNLQYVHPIYANSYQRQYRRNFTYSPHMN